MILEQIAVVGYFSFFWRFLLDRRFRDARLMEWRTSSAGDRFFMLFEAATCAFVGVGIPVLLLWLLLG